MIKLTNGNGRILALLILLAFVALLLSVTLLPVVIASKNYTQKSEELLFRLDRYRQTAALEVPLKTHLSQLTSEQIPEDDLLAGESTAIASANLQELFKQRVEQAGGDLESTQVLAESYTGNMEKIGIRVRFNGTIEALQKTLHNLEFNKPLLFVDNVEISTIRTRRRVKRGTVSTGNLRVAMDISGFRRNGDLQ